MVLVCKNAHPGVGGCGRLREERGYAVVADRVSYESRLELCIVFVEAGPSAWTATFRGKHRNVIAVNAALEGTPDLPAALAHAERHLLAGHVASACGPDGCSL